LKVLPRRDDYSQGPEEGDSLGAHLVRLMTSVNTKVMGMTSTFLFALCNYKRKRGMLIFGWR
jgi:hypothetical protein